jgi:hypothetical protein
MTTIKKNINQILSSEVTLAEIKAVKDAIANNPNLIWKPRFIEWIVKNKEVINKYSDTIGRYQPKKPPTGPLGTHA